MKTDTQRRAASLLFALAIIVTPAIAETIPQLKTAKQVYKNVVIKAVEPDGIRIIHESGAAKVAFDDLTPEQRATYGLTEEKRAENVRRQEAARVAVKDKVALEMADFAIIPGGVFIMGDALDGVKYAAAHKVHVSAFYMQKKEVTKAQWDEVREWALAHGYDDLRHGDGKDTDHPVTGISWHEAIKWCNAKSEKERLTPCYFTDAEHKAVYRTGYSTKLDNAMVAWDAKGYRLPTEAEWEKAARGGFGSKRFPWGDAITHSEANFFSDAAYRYDQSTTRGSHPSYTAEPKPYTSPVGEFPANGYGLYDMIGNVSELCWDCLDWNGYPTAAMQKDSSVTPASSQTTNKQDLAMHLPTGKEMALQAYLDQGGKTKINPYRKVVYTKGPIQGLTKAGAVNRFDDVWAKMSDEDRMIWVRRAKDPFAAPQSTVLPESSPPKPAAVLITTDPRGASFGARVQRGGSWAYSADDCRVAQRKGVPPNGASAYLGFRTVRMP